jgi:uncharacterized membrane protein YkoI
MSRALIVLATALVVCTQASAEPAHCLSRAEQRAAIAEGRAIALAAARRMLRERLSGDMVKARLCETPDGLIYVLTVLAHDGKVRRVTINATNGAVIGSL